MAVRTSPCGWDPSFIGCRTGPCCPDLTDPANAAVVAAATAIAVNTLWRLTGMQFGCCDITVRPCKPETCRPFNLNDLIYWDSKLASRGSGNLGVLSYFPTLVSGQVYNIACGCPAGCCSCRPGCSFRLPGPVCTIGEAGIVVDGVTLAEGTDYILYDDRNEIAFINDTCPSCQNYDLPNGEVGTWSVNYTIGVPVPDELNFAAGLYACEIAKGMLGQACSLPGYAQAVARQGVDIAFVDPIELVREGLVGIPVVDTIIRTLNPYRMAQAPRVWSPDLPVVRREV